MSSYIISKKEYMKAAGLVSGIAAEREVWMYDAENDRNSTPEDYRRHFSDIYRMNGESVKEQYRGEEVGAPAGDTNEYAADFKEYMNLGKQLCYNGGKVLIDGINELSTFFSSILYQIEMDDYHEKAGNYLNRLLVQLYRSAAGRETNSWGSLEINTPDHIYQPLF